MASLREQFKAATTITDPLRRQQATAALVLGIISELEALRTEVEELRGGRGRTVPAPVSKTPRKRP